MQMNISIWNSMKSETKDLAPALCSLAPPQYLY